MTDSHGPELETPPATAPREAAEQSGERRAPASNGADPPRAPEAAEDAHGSAAESDAEKPESAAATTGSQVASHQPRPSQTTPQASNPTPQASNPESAGGDEPSPEDEGQGPRIIALINQKGGVGKTTTAVNLAAALGAMGHRVLAVDLDPQAHLTLSLGIDSESLDKSIYHLLSDPQTTAFEVVMQAHEKTGGEFGVLPAEVNLAGIESELAEKTIAGAAQTVLREKTKGLIQQFDYIILDCPPSLGLLTINALTTAHEIIVPMQAHFLALQGLSKLLETVQMVRQAINPGLGVSGVVLCMHEKQTVLAGEVVSDLEQFLEQARGGDSPWQHAIVYQPPVRRNIKLAECPSFGQSVFTYAPDSNGATDYRRLARHIANHRVAASS